MLTKHLALPACCLAVLVSLAGCASTAHSPQKSAETAATPVKTVAVQEMEITRTTTQPATVHAYFQSEIRARASGFLAELKADIGDFVEKGAVLARIDVPEMEKRRQIITARITRLEAETRRSEAGVELAAARVLAATANFEEAKSQLGRAEAWLAASEAEFSRTQDLVARRSLESRMLDEVRKKRDSALAETSAVASSIDSARAEVVVAQAQRASAEADLEVARAEADIARRELEEMDVLISFATLRAPFAGLITHRNVEPGDLVGQADGSSTRPPLFVLCQVDRVRVRIPVPETDAPMISRGDLVTLTFPSFEREPPLSATVTRRAGSLDRSTRTMLVEAELANTDGKLLPGMFGQAAISVSKKVAANMLPSRAIRFDESGMGYVYIVGQDETVSIQPVTTGIDNGLTIEVVSGVTPGQRVIDAHLKRFANGQKVTILN